MTNERKIVLEKLNHDSANIHRDLNQTKARFHNLSMEKSYILSLIKELNLTDNEIKELNFIQSLLYIEEENNSKDRLAELIDQAYTYINREYETKGKYDGREINSLFRVLFSLISDEALLKFDDG